MKITDIKTICVNMFRCNYFFVEIVTDEGLTGLGEGTLEYKDNALAGAVEDIKRALIGRDPAQISLLGFELYRNSYWREGPVLMSAVSAVDTALWDLKAKKLGVPIYELLGGKFRDSVPMYANCWFPSSKEPDEFAYYAKKTVDMGIKALKWDPFGKNYLYMSNKDLRHAEDIVAAVREAVGPDVDLLIECHGRFDPKTGIQVGKVMEPYNPMFIEEPCPPDDLDALAEVHRKSPVPVAAGERLYTHYQFKQFLEKGCADYVQPDISHCGGITGLMKFAAMAEASYVALAPHNPSGPVASAATRQIAAAVPGFRVLEIVITEVDWRLDITNECVEFRDGELMIESKPGHGIVLNHEECAKHPYTPYDLRHYNGTLTDVRPLGQTSYYFKGLEQYKFEQMKK